MKASSLFVSILFVLTSTTFAQNNKAGGSKGSPSTSAAGSMGGWNNFGGQTHELDVNLSKGQIRSYKEGNNSYTDINFVGSYHYLLQNHIQIGTEAGIFAYRDGTSSTSILALMGLFTYNLDFDITNSIFAQAGLGLYPAYDKTDGKYGSKFSFLFDFGKRISLWNHIAFKPGVRFLKRGDMDMEFMIEALNFSLIF